MASAFLCDMGMERLCSGRRETQLLCIPSMFWLPGTFSCPSQFCHSGFRQPIDLNYYISFFYKLVEQKEQFLWRKKYVCSVNSIGGIICILAQFPEEVKLI